MSIYYILSNMSKLITLYSLEECNLMYIIYTPIKLLKRKRSTNKSFQFCFLVTSVVAE